jgi:hypothetical protein
MLFENDETESSHSTVGWVDKLTAQGILEQGGDFKIFAGCELGGSSTAYAIAARVMIDGVERGIHRFIPEEANQFKSISFPVGLLNLSDDTHTVTIQSAVSDVAQTLTIRRARILVEKH